jgi:hypothetical protein
MWVAAYKYVVGLLEVISTFGQPIGDRDQYRLQAVQKQHKEMDALSF